MNYEKVIKDNEKMIWKIAGHFYGHSKEDLYQAGVVGLLKALKNYKKNGVTKFSTYAHDYIFGEMYLLSCNKNIKVSKDLLKLYKKVENARYVLAQKLNYIPSNNELSEFLNIPLDTISLACSSANVIMSLDKCEDDEQSIYEVLGEREDWDTQILIDESMKVLSKSEQDIIRSRYFEDLTQSEVAKKLNLTQVMVSRYEKRSIDKMRSFIAS